MYTGEQVDRAASYCDGTWSDYQWIYPWNCKLICKVTHHIHQVITYTLVFVETKVMVDSLNTHMDMREMILRTVMGYNVTGGWQMDAGRNDCGCATAQKEQAGYITGGGSSITNKLHFATEIMYNTSDSGDSGDFVAGCGMETRSYFCMEK